MTFDFQMDDGELPLLAKALQEYLVNHPDDEEFAKFFDLSRSQLKDFLS